MEEEEEEERILGEMKRKWWSKTDREKGSLSTNQRAIREEGGERKKEKKDKEREKERKSRTHRARTLALGAATCCASFLPFLQESQREKERK